MITIMRRGDSIVIKYAVWMKNDHSRSYKQLKNERWNNICKLCIAFNAWNSDLKFMLLRVYVLNFTYFKPDDSVDSQFDWLYKSISCENFEYSDWTSYFDKIILWLHDKNLKVLCWNIFSNRSVEFTTMDRSKQSRCKCGHASSSILTI